MATTKKVAKTSARRPPAKKAAKKGAARKSAAKTTARKSAGARATAKAAAKKAGARTTAAKKSAARKVAKPAAKRAGTRNVAKKTAAARKATTHPSGMAARRPATPKGPAPRKATKRRTGITPEQALANTRALLAEKQAHDRETPTWQRLGGGDGGAQHEGFQSESARDRAAELHQGEMHLDAIQGSVSSSGRRRQGRRDSRPGT